MASCYDISRIGSYYFKISSKYQFVLFFPYIMLILSHFVMYFCREKKTGNRLH